MVQLWFLLLCGRSVNCSNSFLIGLFVWFIVILSPAVTVYSVMTAFTVWTIGYITIHGFTCANSEATDGIMPGLQFYFIWAEWLQVLIHYWEKRNSLGFSSSQDDVEVCSRRMETQRDDLNISQVFMHVFYIIPCPWDSLFIHCYKLTTI
jgi:hypothetical protein